MPVPTYTASPINAAKASGVTPVTQDDQNTSTIGPNSATMTSAAGPPTSQTARPVAAPALPTATAALQSLKATQPTPTQPLPQAVPPAPQPGAVPMPPGGRTNLPPPPRAGETLQQMPTASEVRPMPPQMSYPPPTATYPGQGGSSTMPAAPYSQPAGPTPVALSHPPGYRQDIHAAETTTYHQAAQNSASNYPDTSYQEDGNEGIWNTAKKWATAAGDSLAAAENEVWKRVNKE